MNFKQKLSAFFSKYPKNYWYMAATLFVLVVAAVLIFPLHNRNTPVPLVSSIGSELDGGTDEEAEDSTKPPFWQPVAGWTVTNISKTPGDTATDPAHGTFSIGFTLEAKNNDVYFKPTCQAITSNLDTDGVNFIILKDGKRFDDPKLGAGSCVVLNRGLATKTSNGNILLKAGTQNPFEMVVVYHPGVHGTFKARITQIGYGKTDGPSDRLFFIDAKTYEKVKTAGLEL